MSFRPTIAVIIDDQIADIGYYRNWYVEDLFIEALAIAVVYRDVRSLEEYRERAFGRQDIGYVISPEVLENTQENLRWLADCSEFPISVDLTRRAIYPGTGCGSEEWFRKLPEIHDLWFPYEKTEDFYFDILDKYKISFDRADMDNVEDVFLNDSEMRKHLSMDTAKAMRKAFGERTGEPYDETGTCN